MKNHPWQYVLIIFLLPLYALAAPTDNPSGSSPQESTLFIEYVTVIEQTNNVEISWVLETDETVGSIRVHRQMPGGIPLEIANLAPGTTSFTDNGANASVGSYAYYIVALSPEPDATSIVSSFLHGTIFINNAQTDVCAAEIYITWENYSVLPTVPGQPQPPNPFDQVMVLSSFNEGPFEVAGTLEVQQGTQTFVLENALPGSYSFKVQGQISGSGINSFSNVLSIEALTLNPPQFSYIRAVDVIDDQFIELRLHADVEVINPSYVVYRSDNPLEGFVQLETIENNDNIETIIYSDMEANPHSGLWYYKVEVLDSCLNPAIESQVASSLFLSVEQQGMYSNFLSWGHHPGWEGGIQEYEIWRKLPFENNFVLLITLGGGSASFEDNLVNFPSEILTGEIQYRVVGREGAGNSFGIIESVLSNIVTITREEKIFVPNAFRPSSQNYQNREFKPSMAFVGATDYSLEVFNRWGQQIFISLNPDEGWQGTYNGSESPAGVYAWVLKYRDNAGDLQEKRGVVKLLR